MSSFKDLTIVEDDNHPELPDIYGIGGNLVYTETVKGGNVLHKCHNEECSVETSNPKFCSQKCAAKTNNIKFPKRKPEHKCKRCSKNVSAKKYYCSDECKIKYKEENSKKYEVELKILKKTLGEVKKTSSEHQNKFVSVRTSARLVYKRAKLPQSCYICGYDKHIRICHRKAISDYDDSVLIGEINHIDNLVALCPNHHWEFDNKLLNI